MTTDMVALMVMLVAMSLLPIIVVVSTSFLKITVVMSLLRNAMGVQQIPPNIALYGLALILTCYIMAPVGSGFAEVLSKNTNGLHNVPALFAEIKTAAQPLREFMQRNTKPAQTEFFVANARKLWGAKQAEGVQASDFVVLVPAFMVSELSSAFQMGFLLYLPFVVIDLIISNILLAMGMMMVSPVTVSLPLKLLLFVAVDGWTRLIHAMVLAYA